MKTSSKKTSQSTLILLVMLISVVFVILQTRWAEKNRERLFSQELIDRLQQANPTETIRAQCSHCGSRGEFSAVIDGQETDVPCPVCKGLGFSRMTIDKQTQAICPNCHGLQFISDGDPLLAEDCIQCLGTGVVETLDPYGGLIGPVTSWMVECDYCNASGIKFNPASERDEACPVCLGLIHNEVRKFYDNDGICPACGGMGRNVNSAGIYQGACERCNGRGAIASGTSSKD